MSNSRLHRSWRWYMPLSIPLWSRIWRDYWYITIIAGATLFAFHWLVVTFLPLYNLRYRLNYLHNLPDIVKAMIGGDILSMTSTTAIGSFAYIHPVTLAILAAFAVMLPSWVLVGQIDRGTIELLLSTPTSRRKVILTTILAGIVGGILLILSMLIGTWVGVQHTPKLPQPYQFGRIVYVAINLYAIYLVLLSISVFFSAITSIRGIAVGWSIGLGLASYLLHFLAEWWKVVERIAFLGPLYYFRPIKIVAGEYIVSRNVSIPYDPTRDIVTLLVASAVLLIVSTIWFCRRNIAVV